MGTYKKSETQEYLDIPNEEPQPFQKLFSEVSGELQEAFNLSITKQAENSPAKVIKPDLGFCLKIKDADGRKIFINICHCSELPEPASITEDELKAILQSDEPSLYRVPLSLGEPHKEIDKGGQDCTAYDVIVNTEYYNKVQKSELFHAFLVNVSLEGLEDKYDISFNRDSWTILKNKKYHGTMPDHHIRSKPLIAEMGSKPNKPASSFVAETQSVIPDKKYICPSYTLVQKPANGYPKLLVADFSLPLVVNSKTISLDIGEDRIILHEEKNSFHVDIFVPYLIQQDLCEAQFNITKKVLRVKMPVVPEESKN